MVSWSFKEAVFQVSTSTKIYLGLVAFLVAVKLLFLLRPTAFPLAEQESAFYWTTITFIAVIGFLGLVLSRRTGFPDIWDPAVTNRDRFLIPTVIGLIYGVITVINDLPDPAPIHLQPPLSLAFYSYGATFLEIMLRLFAIPFLMWIGGFVLRGRWQTGVFWVAVAIAALYEPLPYLTHDLSAAPNLAAPSIIFKTLTGPLFLANVVAGWLFRRSGFLAPLTMRLSFYLIWHILYGGFLSAALR